MIQRSLRKFSTKWQMFVAVLALVGVLSFGGVPSSPALAASATYSCGTYSSGAYSTSNCATTGGSSVTAPNTGFAKLMEPTNLIAILGSLALLIAGVVIMLKSRSRKKQNISFSSRD